MSNTILIPPQVFSGELLPWKGKYWKVQLYDQAGGMIQLDGETTGQVRAVTQNPVLVLEMQGDTTGEMKRNRGQKKRGSTLATKGFRTRRNYE